MLKTDDGLYINIHEAALVDYPAMYMMVEPPELRPDDASRAQRRR